MGVGYVVTAATFVSSIDTLMTKHITQEQDLDDTEFTLLCFDIEQVFEET